MKKLKRFLSFLLAFLMALTMAPLPAHAEAGDHEPVFTFTSITDEYYAVSPCDNDIATDLPSNYIVIRNADPMLTGGVNYKYQVLDVSMLDPVYAVSEPSENDQGMQFGSRIRENINITGDAPLSMALNAYVELKDACRVTFDLNGGTTDDPVMLHGKFVMKNGVLGEDFLNGLQPVKDGFVFTGWQLDGVSFTPDAPVTGDIVLTAVYTEESPACSHTVTEYVANSDTVFPSATHNEICTECKEILNENVPCHMTVTGCDEEYCDWRCDMCGYAAHVQHQADGGGIPVDNYMHIYKCMYCQSLFGNAPHTYMLGEYGHGRSVCDECGCECVHPDLYYMLDEREEYHVASCVVCGIIGNSERHDVDSGNVLYNMAEDMSKLPDDNASGDSHFHVVHCLKCNGIYLEACTLGTATVCTKCGTAYGAEAGGAVDDDTGIVNADLYDEDVSFSSEASVLSYSADTPEPELYVVVCVSGRQFGSVVSTGDGIIGFVDLSGMQSHGFYAELGAGMTATGSYTISDQAGVPIIAWPSVVFTASETSAGAIPTSGDGWEYIGETDPVAGVDFPCKLTPWEPDFYYYFVAYSNSDTGAADPSVLLKRIDESTMGFTIPGIDVTEHLEIKVTAEPKGTMSVKPYAAGVVAAIYAEKKTVDQASSEDMSRIAVSTNIGSVPPSYHGRQMYPHNVRSNDDSVTTYVALFAPTESEYADLQNEIGDGTWLGYMSRPDDYIPAPERLDGDLNNDGAINIYDAGFLMNVFRGASTLVDKVRADDRDTVLDYLACDLDLSIHVDANDYSAWNKVPDPVEYRVTWDFNGGVDANGEPVATGHEAKTTNKGSAVFSVLKPSPAPTKGDGTLVGWSRDPDAIMPDDGMKTNVTSGIRDLHFTVTEPDVVYYAVYQDLRTQYSLVYDFNGGSVSDPNTSTGRADIGKSDAGYFDFTIQELNPDGTSETDIVSRSGYKFLGWSRDQHAGTAEYQPGETLRVTEPDTTLYAVWECEHAPDQYLYEYIDTGYHNVVCGFCGAMLNREEHTFVHVENGKAWEYICEQCRCKGTQYQLFFNLTGAKYDGMMQIVLSSGVVCNETYSYTIPSNLSDLSKPGYKFLGWAESSTATTAEYQCGEAYHMSAADPEKTLYAVWQKLNNFTLSYETYLDADMPAVQSIGNIEESGYTFTIPDIKPVYAGYEFLGWSLSESASIPDHGTADYRPGDKITVSTENTVLYAVWHLSVYTYTLTYDANGGSNPPVDESAEDASTSYAFRVSDQEPVRSGYRFLGWADNAAGEGTIYKAGDLYDVPNGSYGGILYAVWQRLYNYTLNYSANNGTGAPTAQSVSNVTTDTYKFTIPSTKPTRSGYQFLGWSTSSTATTASYQPGGTYTASKSSTTLYAVWKLTCTHAVSYTYNGNGTHSGSCTCGKTKVTNEACSFASGSKTCSKCGGAAVIRDFTLTSSNRDKIGYSTEYGKASGKLTIPETFQDMSNNGKWYRITSIGHSAFASCSGLTGTITIPGSVTSIDEFAFNGCSGLTGALMLSNGVTSIGDNAFRTCSGLTSVIFPSTLVSIGDHAFYSCTGLTSIPVFPTSLKTLEACAFGGCRFSGTATIPASVTSMSGHPFAQCYNLTGLKVASGNTNFVSVDNVIYTKDKKTLIGVLQTRAGSFTIPNTVTTVAAHAFMSSHLSSITIPSSVKTLGVYSFFNLQYVTSITIPSGITNIPLLAFSSCSNLKSVSLPNTLTTIEANAFFDCSNLTVTIPSSVKTIDIGAFTYVPHIYYSGTATGSPWGAKAIN